MKRERIGPKIKSIRKSKDLTQKQLADVLGYSDKSMITHIEKGDSDMTYEKMLLFMREFMINADELFDVSKIDELLKKYRDDKRTELLQKLYFNPSINYIKYAKQIDYKLILSNELLYFKPVTCNEDIRFCCLDYQLDDKQKEMVNPPYISIARAYTDTNSFYPFIICNKEDTNVGFICLSKWIGKEEAFSFSLLIDKRYQNNGFGLSTIKLAINILKTIDDAKPIKLAVEKSNKKAQALYESLGFKQLDELDGDDLVFAL